MWEGGSSLLIQQTHVQGFSDSTALSTQMNLTQDCICPARYFTSTSFTPPEVEGRVLIFGSLSVFDVFLP